MRAASFATVGRISCCLEKVAVAARRVEAARAVCRSSAGRIMEAIEKNGRDGRQLSTAHFAPCVPDTCRGGELDKRWNQNWKFNDDALAEDWEIPQAI